MSRLDIDDAATSTDHIGSVDAEYDTGLGALGLLCARAYLLILPTLMLGALFEAGLPAKLVFVMPAVAFVLVTPRRILMQLPISPAVVIFCVWIALSVLWTIDSTRTLFLVREDLAPILGAMLVFGLLPAEESVRWFVRGMKLMVLITVLVLVLVPETQTWDRPGGSLEDAWRGWYGSKNQLGRSALLGFMVMLYLDRTKLSRLAFMLTSLVLILGSSSATALAGAMFAFGVWVWGVQFRRTRRQWSGTFIFSSIVIGIVGLVAAFASAAWLVGLFGRDLSFSGRTDVWTPSLDFVAERPWFGYGYRALFGSDTAETLTLQRELGFEAAHSHNGPLEIALGLGLVGLVLFFFVYLATFTAALRYLKESDIALFSFCFLLVMIPVAVVEPVFQGDWFAMLVVCRILLMRVRLDERGAHDPAFRI